MPNVISIFLFNEINNNIMDEIISLINRNYFHNISLVDDKKQKELTFLQRKREEDHLLRIKKDFVFQKEINFSISNSKEKNGNVNQKNELRKDSQSYLINFGVNNCKKIFEESLDNPNPKESNKININLDDMKTNLINMNSINNISFSKTEYFNGIKNVNKKFLFDSNNKNEIKVLKNKKPVYIDKYFLNANSISRNIKKLKKNKFIIRNKTSSKYLGVSKNGSKWQVLMKINKKQSYIGSYPSEELAARVYDVLAIKNRGIKARTNFIYNNIQKNIISESKINIKSDNISDIINQLTN